MGIRFGKQIGVNVSVLQMTGLCFAESLAFFAVLPILCSMTIKSNDNVRQIASIGMYIRICFEYIPKIKGSTKDILNWESIDSRINMVKLEEPKIMIERGKNKKTGSRGVRAKKIKFSYIHIYNREYFFLTSLSSVFWTLSVISYIDTALKDRDNVIVCILATLAIMIFFFEIFIGWKYATVILEESDVIKNFNEVSHSAGLVILKEAKDRGFLTREEYEKALNEFHIEDDRIKQLV
jgi:hypothetical protein